MPHEMRAQTIVQGTLHKSVNATVPFNNLNTNERRCIRRAACLKRECPSTASSVWHACGGDAFYDRGSTFPMIVFLNDAAPWTQNRRNANLVSKKNVLVYLGHEIIHRAMMQFGFAEASFGVRYGAPQVRILTKRTAIIVERLGEAFFRPAFRRLYEVAILSRGTFGQGTSPCRL